MIKLNRAAPPSYLSPSRVTELTKKFKSEGKPVWNHKEIKNQLLQSSYEKCAYCECKVKKEGIYMEVEHFENKKDYPDKVVIWDNLLPSCKRCNGTKGTHDVLKDPIVNPYLDDPKEHLGFRSFRLRGVTPKGRSTIEVIDLNHYERLVQIRFDIGTKVSEKAEELSTKLKSYLHSKDTKSKNRLINAVRGLLRECLPEAHYAACTATLLLTDQDFIYVVEQMKNENIWTNELEDYYQKASKIVLPCV